MNKIDQRTPSWTEIKREVCRGSSSVVAKENCSLVCGDTTKVLPRLPSASIDCIITSPPYGDLKDYGASGQIGFGQHREQEYFPAIEAILRELLRVTRDGGALWVVLDTLKDRGEMVPLPWQVIAKAQEAGWTFHDLVVWDKGKSLPWSHRGRFRGVCEYILLLGKGTLKCFDLDAARDSDHLSSYWVRYPERYHPDGKAPSDLWHFPIPLQGSWSQRQSRHFCPFPVGLVARMLAITTRPGDIVLDPFAGTGTVPAVASQAGRRALGIELNPKYVKEFDRSGFAALQARAAKEAPLTRGGQAPLREVIVRLRMLKFAKTLFAELSRADRLNGSARASIAAFVVREAVSHAPPNQEKVDSRALGTLQLDVLAQPEADTEALRAAIDSRLKVAPLSKFGIAARVTVRSARAWHRKTYFDAFEGRWHVYRRGEFYRYDEVVNADGLLDVTLGEAANTRRKVPTILARLAVDVTRPVDEVLR